MKTLLYEIFIQISTISVPQPMKTIFVLREYIRFTPNIVVSSSHYRLRFRDAVFTRPPVEIPLRIISEGVLK